MESISEMIDDYETRLLRVADLVPRISSKPFTKGSAVFYVERYSRCSLARFCLDGRVSVNRSLCKSNRNVKSNIALLRLSRMRYIEKTLLAMYRDIVPIVKEKRSLAAIDRDTIATARGTVFVVRCCHRTRTGKSRARIEARHAIGRERPGLS